MDKPGRKSEMTLGSSNSYSSIRPSTTDGTDGMLAIVDQGLIWLFQCKLPFAASRHTSFGQLSRKVLPSVIQIQEFKRIVEIQASVVDRWKYRIALHNFINSSASNDDNKSGIAIANSKCARPITAPTAHDRQVVARLSHHRLSKSRAASICTCMLRVRDVSFFSRNFELAVSLVVPPALSSHRFSLQKKASF